MPVISTTPLRPDESILIDRDRDCAINKIDARQVAALEAKTDLPSRDLLLEKRRARKAASDAAVQAIFASVLAGRTPPIPVPPGATITRSVVGGADSLVVST